MDERTRTLWALPLVSAFLMIGASCLDGAAAPAAMTQCRPLGVTRALAPVALGPVFFNGYAGGPTYAAIGRAGARDPVLEPPKQLPWARTAVKDPYVVASGGRRFLFFSALNEEGPVARWAVGLADERNGRFRIRATPIVAPYEADGTHPFPVVVRTPSRWVLFFGDRGTIKVATSRDTRRWRIRKRPAVRIPNALVTPGDVIQRGGRWVLVYSRSERVPGSQDRWRPRLAHADRVLGPYRTAGPLRWREERATALTREAATGSRVLRLRRPLGAGLVMVAGPTGFQYVHVDRRGRTAEPLAAQFPAGTPVLPAALKSVTVEFVSTRGARTYVLGTAFHLLPGCIAEVAVLGTLSPDLRRIDWLWKATPVVPYGGRTWHRQSAENPVLVRSFSRASARGRGRARAPRR